jgi:hypothetical protein
MPTKQPTRIERASDPRYATPAADPETQWRLRREMLGLTATVAVTPENFETVLVDMRIAASRERRLADLARMNRKNNGEKE